MIDNVTARILCDRLGIFGFKEQAAMHQFLDSVVRHKSMQPEVAVEYCVQRWEEYMVAAPDLKWIYGSPFTFFIKGLWDKSDLWPWKERRDYGPDPNVGVYRVQ
jgi:hypothetical protein